MWEMIRWTYNTNIGANIISAIRDLRLTR
jgi:hypothetical protein